MKNLFLLLLLLPVVGWSQIVDGVNIAKDTDVDYLEILGYNQGVFKKKIVIIVDYGQKIKMFESDTRVEGTDGSIIIFNSMMDAVNQFSKWGWELMFAYDVSTEGGGTVYHYVLHRKPLQEKSN